MEYLGIFLFVVAFFIIVFSIRFLINKSKEADEIKKKALRAHILENKRKMQNAPRKYNYVPNKAPAPTKRTYTSNKRYNDDYDDTMDTVVAAAAASTLFDSSSSGSSFSSGCRDFGGGVDCDCSGVGCD